MTWLVNTLLELGIRTSHWTSLDAWRETPDGGWTLAEPALGLLKWHLPALHRQDALRFRNDHEVVWEHRLDFARRPLRAAVLYLRDPRDAIHSLYRRDHAHALDYHAYLDRRDVWPDHFPELFFLPPPETYLLFVLFWLTVGESVPLLTVTFEDMRADPAGTLGRVLSHLGESRDEAAVLDALARSDFQAARHAMLRTSAEQGTERLTAARGQVGEWRDSHDAAALARFAGPLARFESLLAGLPTWEADWLAPAAGRDHFGWLAGPPPAGLAAVLKAAEPDVVSPVASVARAAIVAGWFTAASTGTTDFRTPLASRLFPRFHGFLLDGLDAAPVAGLLTSHHFERILQRCRERATRG